MYTSTQYALPGQDDAGRKGWMVIDMTFKCGLFYPLRAAQ